MGRLCAESAQTSSWQVHPTKSKEVLKWDVLAGMHGHGRQEMRVKGRCWQQLCEKVRKTERERGDEYMSVPRGEPFGQKHIYKLSGSVGGAALFCKIKHATPAHLTVADKSLWNVLTKITSNIMPVWNWLPLACTKLPIEWFLAIHFQDLLIRILNKCNHVICVVLDEELLLILNS